MLWTDFAFEFSGVLVSVMFIQFTEEYTLKIWQWFDLLSDLNWISPFDFPMCVTLLLLKITVRKEASVTIALFSELSTWSPEKCLTLCPFNYDLRIWLVLSRQVLFCSVLFSWCVSICLASYLVGCITWDLVILVSVFPGKGGTVEIFQS